jgi:hypothetical protein
MKPAGTQVACEITGGAYFNRGDVMRYAHAHARAVRQLAEALRRGEKGLPITAKQIKRIHLLARQTKLITGKGKTQDDTKYREFLRLEFGVSSSKELDRFEAHRCIEHIDTFAKRTPKSARGVPYD